jgi:hypothetical protein
VDAPVPMHMLADEQQDAIGRNAAYFTVEA